MIKSKRVCLSSTKNLEKQKKNNLRLPSIYFGQDKSLIPPEVPENMNDDEGHITLNIMQYRENGNISKRYVLCLVFCVCHIFLCIIQISYIPRQLPQREKKTLLPHTTHFRPHLQFRIMNKCNLPFFFSFNIIWGFVVFVCW